MGLARWQISFWQPNGGGKMLEKMSLDNGPSLHQCERNWVKCSSSSSNSKTFRKSGRSNSILAAGVGWWTDLWHKLIELGFKLWLQKWKKNPKNRPSSLMISILEQFHHFHLNASQKLRRQGWCSEKPPKVPWLRRKRQQLALLRPRAVWAILEINGAWNSYGFYKFTNFQISMDFSWFLPQALTLVTSYWYYLPLYHYALLPLCDSYNSPFRGSWLPFCLTFVCFSRRNWSKSSRYVPMPMFFRQSLSWSMAGRRRCNLQQWKKSHEWHPQTKDLEWFVFGCNKKQHAIACYVPLYINMYTHTYSSGGPSGIMHAFVRDCSTHYG